MKSLLERIAAIVLVLFSIPFAFLPLAFSRRLGRLLGAAVHFLWRSRRKIAIENIKLACKSGGLAISSNPASLARENMENLGESFAEMVKIYAGFGRKIMENVRIEGIDNFLHAIAQNKGIISITGHCGNWELMAIACGLQIKTSSVVARRQNNVYIDAMVERMRTRYGNKVIYKKGALRQIMSVLRGNGSVGILMDQAVSKDEGYVVDFLGRGAWTTKMPALLARKTGAAVLPVFIRREGTGHVIMISPQIRLSDAEGEQAVIDDTISFTSSIEDYVKKWPQEWLWIHKRWKRVLPDDNPVKKSSQEK
ncbi:MAG: lysophospholipid acyltransferase family protein [Nitrospiraceae bacterium]|nr:lysophospholipid acyltransferase family protein [Nitrospiraceae bacterium]